MEVTVVLFGASGHLARTKIINALETLKVNQVIGFSRTPRDKLRLNLSKEMAKRFMYVQGDYDSEEAFKRINDIINTSNTLIVHLAVPFTMYMPICGMVSKYLPSCKVLLEKPFGNDLKSFEKATETLLKTYPQEQLFCIDHFICKAGLCCIEDALSKCGVTKGTKLTSLYVGVSEPTGLDGRERYFDDAGIVRDMMQNHLLQIYLRFLRSFRARGGVAPRDVLDELPALQKKDVLLAQYVKGDNTQGYADELGRKSDTATFAAFKIKVQGITVVLVSGKGLKDKSILFRFTCDEGLEGELQIEPSICVKYKNENGEEGRVELVSEGDDSYVRLYKAAIEGDRSFFVDIKDLRHSWRIVDNILPERTGAITVYYARGSLINEVLKEENFGR